MPIQNVRAIVTGFNGQQFCGTITKIDHENENTYQFTFDGGFESIQLFKVGAEWVYAGGMRVPHEHWIKELGEQIDQIVYSAL